MPARRIFICARRAARSGLPKRQLIWNMTLNSDHRRSAKQPCSGFTLAEVLAALLLLSIVIPVALQGLRVASTAGEVGQRKMIATRIGNKVLNELKVTGQLQNTGQTGVVQDHGISYRWNVKNQSWSEDSLSKKVLAERVLAPRLILDVPTVADAVVLHDTRLNVKNQSWS